MSYISWRKSRSRGCTHFLRRDTSGSVAVMAALCMVILLGFGSLALDFGLSQVARAKLESAADAASLRAARTAVDRMINMAQYGNANWSTAQADGVGTGAVGFAANAGKIYGVEIPTPTVTVTNDGGIVKASVAWSTESSLSLGRALGWSSIKLSGRSDASASLPKYYQFVFLVDVSNSMAIGGTTDAISALLNDPQIGCSFACHDTQHYQSADYRTDARNKSIKLKIDFVSDALKLFMTQMAQRNATATTPRLYSAGIYTFGSVFSEFIAPTTDITAATTAAAKVDVEDARAPDPTHNGYTYLNDALYSLSAKLQNVGDGSSESERKTYVVILTDGIQDVKGPSGNRVTSTDYLSGCVAVKAKGVELVSILAPVLPLTGSDTQKYVDYIQPIAPNVASTLKSCSSDPARGFFEATSGPAISTAVNTMLLQALAPLALTR